MNLQSLPSSLDLDSGSSSDNEPNEIANAARNLGLKLVPAWVPDDKETKRTAGAVRTQRSREKAEQCGHKQLSVTFPVELHPILKKLAVRSKAGEPVEVVLAELIPELPGHLKTNSHVTTEQIKLKLSIFPAWRRWLLYWLLTPELRDLIS